MLEGGPFVCACVSVCVCVRVRGYFSASAHNFNIDIHPLSPEITTRLASWRSKSKTLAKAATLRRWRNFFSSSVCLPVEFFLLCCREKLTDGASLKALRCFNFYINMFLLFIC